MPASFFHRRSVSARPGRSAAAPGGGLGPAWTRRLDVGPSSMRTARRRFPHRQIPVLDALAHIPARAGLTPNGPVPHSRWATTPFPKGCQPIPKGWHPIPNGLPPYSQWAATPFPMGWCPIPDGLLPHPQGLVPHSRWNRTPFQWTDTPSPTGRDPFPEGSGPRAGRPGGDACPGHPVRVDPATRRRTLFSGRRSHRRGAAARAGRPIRDRRSSGCARRRRRPRPPRPESNG